MRAIALVMLSIFISGCTGLEQYSMFDHDVFKQRKKSHYDKWVEQYCNTTGAYNAGLKQGLTPHKHPHNGFADRCPEHQSIFNNAYLTGYSDGLKKRHLRE